MYIYRQFIIYLPKDTYRLSLATYYLNKPNENTVTRGRALFSPTQNQIDDPSINQLIRDRSDINRSKSVYTQ